MNTHFIHLSGETIKGGLLQAIALLQALELGFKRLQHQLTYQSLLQKHGLQLPK